MNKTKRKIGIKKPAQKPGEVVKLPVSSPWYSDTYFIFLLLIVIIISIIRFRLRTMPLERDEGEYAYIGEMMLNGIAPFKSAYSMKLPGTSFMYSIIMFLFGRNSNGIHLGLMVINAATMCFFYFALKKLYNTFIALTASSIYGFMALSEVFYGFAAHATHFIVFYVSIAFLFFVNYLQMVKTPRALGASLYLFLTGLMLGMAFLMKQQAVYFILFGGLAVVLILLEEKRGYVLLLKKLFVFSAGVFIPYMVLLLLVWSTGQFEVFALWTLSYATSYEKTPSLAAGEFYFMYSFLPAWQKFWYLWILSIGGLIILIFGKFSGIQKKTGILFFLGSLGALSAGLYFRIHYFIVVLPFVALLAAIAINYIAMRLGRVMKAKSTTLISLVLLMVLVAVQLYWNRAYYFSISTEQLCRSIYNGNPFPEVIQIAKYIKENSKDSDKIAVFGSEPELLFYTNRQSATGFIYMYPLVEKQPYNILMQTQMMEEIKKSKPAFIVYFNTTDSWLSVPGVPTKIFDLVDEYAHTYCTPVGIVDYSLVEGKWKFYWNDDIKNRTGKPDASIIILKRNAGE